MHKSLSHTKWNCKYHVVLVPKYRRKVIFGVYRVEIGKILRKLCEYKGIEIIKSGACKDHIHMCISIPPKYSVSVIMGYLKGKSALRFFDKYPKFKKQMNSRSLWTKGYYVDTVGLNEEIIKKYIAEQEKYDKNEN